MAVCGETHCARLSHRLLSAPALMIWAGRAPKWAGTSLSQSAYCIPLLTVIGSERRAGPLPPAGQSEPLHSVGSGGVPVFSAEL
jgi:hypothetical protein